MNWRILFICLLAMFQFPCFSGADPISLTTCAVADEFFHPMVSVRLVDDGDGRFDFGGLQIDGGITVGFDLNGLNTAIDIFSSEDIVVHGVLDALGSDLRLSTPSNVIVSGEIIAENISISGAQVILAGNNLVSNTMSLQQVSGYDGVDINADGMITLSGSTVTLEEAGIIRIEAEDFDAGQGARLTIGGTQIFPVPEPATGSLLLAGCFILGMRRIRISGGQKKLTCYSASIF